MTPFELISARDDAGLAAMLRATPELAASHAPDGASLLAFAAYNGNAAAIAIIREFRRELDPYEAIIVGDKMQLERLMAAGWDANARAPDGFPPLALATYFGQQEAFDLLLPMTGNVNDAATNPQQVAALHAASAVGALDMAEKLLRAGADPNQPQQHGFVPLHSAAMNGDARLAGLLLLFGADPDRRDAEGRTAADHARTQGHDWLATRLGRLAAAPGA